MEEKRCSNCNGTLKLSPDQTKWICDFCESEFWVEKEFKESVDLEKPVAPTAYYIGSVKVEKDCISKIDAYIAENKKLDAIKYVREITNSGLKDAKDWVENYKNLNLSEPQDMGTVSPQSTGKSGCYVATAVYGSYDCPEVWTLRRFRDTTLAETWYGRAFIKFYYAVSPTLVKWFGDAEWFKKMWKGHLDQMVADLQAKGVESTPYEDKNW